MIIPLGPWLALLKRAVESIYNLSQKGPDDKEYFLPYFEHACICSAHDMGYDMLITKEEEGTFEFDLFDEDGVQIKDEAVYSAIIDFIINNEIFDDKPPIQQDEEIPNKYILT